MTPCKWCGRTVLFVQLAPNGKAAPMDPDPSPRGNVRVDWPHERLATGRVLRKPELDQAREARDPLYLSHFATCPKAKQRRSRK